MQINDFRSIVTTFADPGTEILFDRTQVMISVNGDLIDATISTRDGDVYVDEGGGAMPASKWILTRLAKLQLLASRLLSSVSPTEYFVSPSALLLPTLEKGPQEQTVASDDAVNITISTLNERSPLETMVLYITSDAGEGKTSLINQLTISQAKLFVENKTDWLLVPIPLGGRHFLRFDDITIGALQNRYRFPFLYYNSFLALVRMGVIVPAFDGFEEMFVEGSSGEALSAMGILVSSLESQGALVVAARKAYFEFENLRIQERLFDTIRAYSVGFGKLELNRWAQSQFVTYCKNRGVQGGEELYQRVSERLGSNHALLTRAVLVKKLVDVAIKSPSMDALLEQLHQSGADFFAVFVRSLVEREANEKWIDRTGENEVGTPLLTVNEHCYILSLIALAMWDARVDYLKRDGLEFVAEYFCETTKKDAFQSQQIRERVRGHAMLVPSTNSTQAVEFDHDEFRLFFLGEGVARQLSPMNDRAKADTVSTFRRGVLPLQAQHAFVRSITRDHMQERLRVVQFILELAKMDVQASYTHENCTDILIQLISDLDVDHLDLDGLVFAANSLQDRKLSNVVFRDCYFGPTSMDLTELVQCTFINCSFGQMRVFGSTVFKNVIFDNCIVDALVLSDKERESWDPMEVRHQLKLLGVMFKGDVEPELELTSATDLDQDLLDLEKIVRYFMRSTHISESVMRIKLGVRGQGFIDHTLPKLLKHGVMEEIENRGGNEQRRFRLKVASQTINETVINSKGSFDQFLSQLSH